MANGIGWDETVPADTESAGLGDDRMRSMKTSLRAALDDEHNFPSSGGDNVGYHRYGSARVHVGTQSRVSSTGTDGRLMQASDTSRLFGVGSGGTVLLGAGPNSLSVGSNVHFGLPQRHYWAEELGEGRTDSTGSLTITFPNSGFSGVPMTQITRYMNSIGLDSVIGSLNIETQSATQIIVTARLSSNGAPDTSGCSFYWRSVGTRAL